jgi:hypothetical protein
MKKLLLTQHHGGVVIVKELQELPVTTTFEKLAVPPSIKTVGEHPKMKW